MDLFDVALTGNTVKRMDFQTAFRGAGNSFKNLASTTFSQFRPGERIYMETDKGERLILVVTPFGNVVLHETDRASETVIAHAIPELQGIFGNGKLTDDQVAMVLGLWGRDNIGELLTKLISYDKERVA